MCPPKGGKLVEKENNVFESQDKDRRLPPCTLAAEWTEQGRAYRDDERCDDGRASQVCGRRKDEEPCPIGSLKNGPKGWGCSRGRFSSEPQARPRAREADFRRFPVEIRIDTRGGLIHTIFRCVSASPAKVLFCVQEMPRFSTEQAGLFCSHSSSFFPS